MAAVIVSDRPVVATHLRRVLLAQGRDCPLLNLVSLSHVHKLAGIEAGEVLFFILPEHGEVSTEQIRQLRERNSCRIVCVGTPPSPRAVLEVLHAGADDYVDESSDLERQVLDVLIRLESVRRENQPVSKVIAVTSASGGVGCTMLASNLSVAFAQRLKGSGLLDLASDHGAVGDHFDFKPRHTLGDLLRSIDSLDAKVIAESLSNHSSGVSVLAGGLSPDDLSDCPAEDIATLVKLARPSRPCWVIDSDDRAARRFDLARLADMTVLVVRLDFPSLYAARRLLDDWQRIEINPQRILIVANRTGQPAEIPPAKALSFLRRPLDFSLPDDPFSANVSLNCGVPVLQEAPKSDLATQIHRLADHLLPSVPPTDVVAKAESSVQSIARILRSIAIVPT